MDKKEYVKNCFDEAKSGMRRYFTTLQSNDTNFNEFELMYDNLAHSVQLWVKNNDNTFSELDSWQNFNLTMFKQLVSLADQFSKKKDNFELWDVIPIKLSMRL